MMSRLLMTVALCGLPIPAAMADRLETAPPNNGLAKDGGSVFVDLTARSRDLLVSEVGIVVLSLQGPVHLRVWRREGTYVGFDGSPEGWTLIDEVDAVSRGNDDPTPFILNHPLVVRTDEVSGLLFETDIGLLYYTGVPDEPPQTIWKNDDLMLLSDVARRSPPFEGTRLNPRCFSGYIEYSDAVSLSVSGECPGPVTFDVAGATPGGLVALGYARGAGEQPIPPGRPCAGVVLGLNHTPQLLGARTADDNGAASFTTAAPPAACGRVFIQAIDIESCATTTVETL